MRKFSKPLVVAAIATYALALHMHARAADLIDTAAKAGSFKTLLAAVDAAGLTATLKSGGPFTLFAPSDEAFAKIPPAQLEALLKDKEQLAKILSYHVLPGKVMAKDVAPGQVKTAQGGMLTIATQGGVTVDGAKVVATDVMADNGVIHVIDSVIVPK